MDFSEYQEEASKTIPANLDEDEVVNNAVYGLIGEVGELVDIIKKVKFQGHPMNMETVNHLRGELGDCLWYLSEMATGLGFPLREVAQANIIKIRARYGEHFDTEKSQNRKEGDI